MKHAKACWQNPGGEVDLDGLLPDLNVAANNTDGSDEPLEVPCFSQTIPAGYLDDASINFRGYVSGLKSGDNTSDTTIQLRIGVSGGTMTDIVNVTTVANPDEDDKAFVLEFFGRIHTVGATGKVVAQMRFDDEATGMAQLLDTTAAAGVTVNLVTADTIDITLDDDQANPDASVKWEITCGNLSWSRN